MKKIILISLSIIIITFILVYFFNKKNENIKSAVMIVNRESINLEVARTEQQKELGLMFRKKLCDKCGMIFIFDEEESRTFWMKNTYIPLDIIFLSKNMKVNKIFKNVEEYNENMSDDELPKIESYAKYVIEINAGQSEKLGIKEGEKVKIKFFFNN
ncbi:MAG: DUF192 domain-containing protein [Elusimicrobiales bacterium]|jgi:uncharacterized membrane protein (UPF0127 family)|nr:DUF192 domain-containing protein [Elusimicrobiales bacterium]NLH39586.1 DUF192 domain-containing protein [Elusimicrobiota bacterium]